MKLLYENYDIMKIVIWFFTFFQNVKQNLKPIIRMQKHLFADYLFMDWQNL